MKIGLFGGSFDPIHYGHLILAEQGRTQLDLDEIWFIPCGKSPYENKNIKTSISHRLEMLYMTLDNQETFLMSEYEIYKPNVTYTIDTVKYFVKEFQNDEFTLIVGPDGIETFDTWKDSDKIRKLVTVAFAGSDFWCPTIPIRSTLIPY